MKNSAVYPSIIHFLVFAVVVYLIYLLVLAVRGESSEVVHSLRQGVLLLLGFVVVSALSVFLFKSFNTFFSFFNGPLGFLQLKAVATTKIWPNVYTTVAELGGTSFSSVISQMGGKFLCVVSFLGIIASFWKRDGSRFDIKYGVLFLVWFVAAAWASTKGMRFSLMLVPPFAFGIGSFAGFLYNLVADTGAKAFKINRYLAGSVLVILLFLVLLRAPIAQGYHQAYNEIPSMDDGWFGSLTKIKDNSASNAIITSWWDFGHWFKAIADRPVTFDGGSQNRPQAHWVGKTLLSSNESVSVGILRMLDCGANSAFDELDKIFNDSVESVKVINEIIVQDRETALITLSENGLSADQIASILSFTHCQPPEAFFITSEDMVGKAGVWGHFGSWDFVRASMFQRVKPLDQSAGTELLMSEFNVSSSEADSLYSDIQTKEADRWISPWPNYAGGFVGCDSPVDGAVTCVASFQGQSIPVSIDLLTHNASIQSSNGVVFPNSLVYIDQGEIREKRFSGNLLGLSVLFVPDGDGFKLLVASPEQANSLFTKLFFLDGHGTKCFELFDDRRSFSGGRILVWKVDWSCSQGNVVFKPKEELRASHIIITLDNRSEGEALELIKEIERQVTPDNFAGLAMNLSEGPSASRGGDLGWFGQGMMVEEFEDAVFNLSINEVSAPVKTQFGYHLILLVDRREV